MFGFAVDIFLVYFALQSFASSYYIALLAPTVVFSIIGYQSALFRVAGRSLDISAAMAFSFVCICGTTYAFYLNELLTLSGGILILSTLCGVVLYYSLGNLSDDLIWVGPASWVLLPACGLIFAVFFGDYANAPFWAVISALLIRSLMLVALSRDSLSGGMQSSETPMLLTLLILVLLSSRLVTSLFYRIVLPDNMVVEYSFNSRLALNFFAFMLIPMFIKLGVDMPKRQSMYMLAVSMIVFIAGMLAQGVTIVPKIDLSYLAVSLALVPLVFVWDHCILMSRLAPLVKITIALGMGTLVLLSSAHFYPNPDWMWMLGRSNELLVCLYLLFLGGALLYVRGVSSEG